MASTNNIHNSPVGAVIHGGNNTIENIIVNANNPQPEVNESEFDLPRLIDTFHGREEEFNQLEKLFFSKNKNKINVHALPGYGKSELCKQFAQRCLKKKRVQRVFWMKAENIDELNKYSACLKTIYKKYDNKRCMFVFDNALNRRSISDYEPANNKHKMLVTSHVKDWGHGVVSLPLHPLPDEPVTKIFKTILEENYREKDHSLYLELGRTVDNVPLGVQIVAGYARQGYERYGQSFQLIDCVKEMKQSKHQIINDTFSKDNPNPYKNSIYGALTISLNKMKEEEDIQRRELAVTVLFVSAFLGPEWIYCDYLIKIPTIKGLIGDSEIKLTSAIRLLINFSFVNYRDTKGDKLNIHKLVQSYLRQYLSSCDLEDKRCYSACVHAMFSLFWSVLRSADVSTEQECVKFLEKVFQDSNGSGEEIIYKYYLFKLAAKWNRIKVLKLLLQNADINKLNEDGHEVMYSVALTWNAEAVELLIARGVDVNHRDDTKGTPMDALLSLLAVYKFIGEYDNVMSTLVVMLEHGALFDKNVLSEESEFLLLSSAAKMNKLDVLQSLMQKGFNVNSRGSIWLIGYNSVLHEAAAGGNFECIQMLVSHGADVNVVDNNNETVLFQFFNHVIRNNRNIDKQELREILVLLNCEEHAQSTTARGRSLLHRAAEGAHEELVTVLIETYNCQLNKQDKYGDTPLHSLIDELDEDSNKEEVVQTVRILLRHGASLDTKNHWKKIPLQLLKSRSKILEENFNYLVPLLTPATTNTEPERKNCNIL